MWQWTVWLMYAIAILCHELNSTGRVVVWDMLVEWMLYCAAEPPLMGQLTCVQLRDAQYLHPGSYRPQCTETGDFAAMQCHAATGECWCVRRNGQEIPGTITRAPRRPLCHRHDGMNLKLLFIYLTTGRGVPHDHVLAVAAWNSLFGPHYTNCCLLITSRDIRSLLYSKSVQRWSCEALLRRLVLCCWQAL